MNPTIPYKANDTYKSYREVFYDARLWISDFDFFKTELLFLKVLLKSNSFKSNIPNLFERLQLLIKELLPKMYIYQKMPSGSIILPDNVMMVDKM